MTQQSPGSWQSFVYDIFRGGNGDVSLHSQGLAQSQHRGHLRSACQDDLAAFQAAHQADGSGHHGVAQLLDGSDGVVLRLPVSMPARAIASLTTCSFSSQGLVAKLLLTFPL